MELANALLDLWARKWLVLLVALISVVVGVLLAFDVSVSPFKLEKKGLQVGTASTQVFVDTRDPAVDTLSNAIDPYKDPSLIQRAHTLARIMPSYEIRRDIADRLGVDADDIAVTPPTDPAQTGTRPEQTGSQRATALISAQSDYQLSVSDSTQAPTIDLVAQTTDPQKASALASASVAALQAFLTRTRRAGTIPQVVVPKRPKTRRAKTLRREAQISRQRRTVAVRSLGPPTAGTITTGANVQLAVAGAIATFVFGCLLILGLAGLRRGVSQARLRRELEAAVPVPAGLQPGTPHLLTSAAAGIAALQRPDEEDEAPDAPRDDGDGDGDPPATARRTARVPDPRDD